MILKFSNTIDLLTRKFLSRIYSEHSPDLSSKVKFERDPNSNTNFHVSFPPCSASPSLNLESEQHFHRRAFGSLNPPVRWIGTRVIGKSLKSGTASARELHQFFAIFVGRTDIYCAIAGGPTHVRPHTQAIYPTKRSTYCNQLSSPVASVLMLHWELFAYSNPDAPAACVP